MRLRLAAGAGLLLLGTAAQAADGDVPKPDRLVSIGLGAQVLPKFPGAKDVTVAPLPRIDIRHVGDPLHFGAPDQGRSAPCMR